ncbi:hypothetical protein [Haloarchaeobius iranensis]|uniref:Uncharacterized protein n=1 Tax=Haloarchaeobius iranensis TaxID=996166 RepID=A0A1G9Z6Y9_9EURY|nr:hypothetical protein [Haloarchaeobius iranensis]SDN17090.1 hypothetical protein SAMN05192554_11857 [Haloarchaeobius iranensis]
MLDDLRDRWDTDRTVEPFEHGARPHDPSEPPETVDGQLERIAGIASVVVFYTDAREETGMEVELTELRYSGRFRLQYRNGASVTLPLAQFAGHRAGGSLTVDRELLPDCREREEILALLTS